MDFSFTFFIVAAVVVGIVVLVSYRSGRMGQYGTFEPSNKVAHQFKRGELPMQYHYYYYGDSPKDVFALVGLDHRYTMGDADWIGFNPEDAILEDLLAHMTSDTIEPAEGYVIIGPDKSPMGIFYSTLPNPTVQIDARQQVIFTLDVPSSLTYGE